MVQLVGLHQPLRIAAPRRPAEIFVARPGDPLHRRDGGEDERDDGGRRPGWSIDKSLVRSEERRVGNVFVKTYRTSWSPVCLKHLDLNKNIITQYTQQKTRATL